MTSSLGYIGIDPDEVYTAQQVTDGEVPHKLGTIGAAYDSGGRYCVYKFVQLDEGTLNVAAVAGNVVYYALDGYKTNTVITDVSQSIGTTGPPTPVAGVWAAGVLQAAIEDDGQGWIQVQGFATLNLAIGGSATDGDVLVVDNATDGGLTRRDQDYSLSGNAETLEVYGFETPMVALALDASDKEVLLTCPF